MVITHKSISVIQNLKARAFCREFREFLRIGFKNQRELAKFAAEVLLSSLNGRAQKMWVITGIIGS